MLATVSASATNIRWQPYSGHLPPETIATGDFIEITDEEHGARFRAEVSPGMLMPRPRRFGPLLTAPPVHASNIDFDISIGYQVRTFTEPAYQSQNPIQALQKLKALLKRKGAEIESDAKESLQSATNDAIMFISILPRNFPALDFGVAEDGEIVFEWAVGEKEAVVSFNGDGIFEYALLKGDLFVPGAHEGLLEGDLPEDLKKYLSFAT